MNSVTAYARPGGMRVCPAGNGKGACACLRTPRVQGWSHYPAEAGGVSPQKRL